MFSDAFRLWRSEILIIFAVARQVTTFSGNMKGHNFGRGTVSIVPTFELRFAAVNSASSLPYIALFMPGLSEQSPGGPSPVSQPSKQGVRKRDGIKGQPTNIRHSAYG